MSENAKNRELERKLVVKGMLSLTEVSAIILDALHGVITETVHGASKDRYWKAPPEGKADFIRFRELEDSRAELTAKWKDKGNNIDRVEINNAVLNRENFLAYMALVHGDPVVEIMKHYTVFFCPNGLNVSAYRVAGDERVFVEIEGLAMKDIDSTLAILDKLIPLERETRSLFEIFYPGAPTRTAA